MASNHDMRSIQQVLNEILSDKIHIESLSFHHFQPYDGCYQETETSMSFNISVNNISNFSHILAALASGRESQASFRMLEFHRVEWTFQEQKILCNWLKLNTCINRVVFRKNNFGDRSLSEFSEMLKRNIGIKELVFLESGIGSVGVSFLALGLSENKTVEELQIWDDSIGSKGAEDISQMIEANSTLKLLIILDSETITAAPIISAVLGRNRMMELHVWNSTSKDKNHKIVELVPEMNALRAYKFDIAGACRITCALGWNSTIKSLDMTGIQLKSRWAKEFQRVLEQNKSLKYVNLSRTKLKDKAAIYIAAALFKNQCLEGLELEGNLFGGVGIEHLLCPMSRFSMFYNQANMTLKSLTFGSGKAKINVSGMVAITKMIATNQSVTQLAICNNKNLKCEDFIKIFKSIEANSTLKYLSFRGCQGIEGKRMLEAIMDTLQVNPWIEDIDLTGTPLENGRHTDEIYKKLRMNGRLIMEVDLLKDIPLTKPKCCRVFLCGQGSSGKSTLCGTISQIFSSSKIQYTDHMRSLKSSVEQGVNTGGIRIKTLKDDDLKISMWDLAGENTFHVFHELIFPEQGSPTFFLIVSSMFKKPTNREPKQMHEIEEDIQYWLRFIITNSKKAQSQSLLPNVAVVLTHFDKLMQPTEYLKQIASCTNRLREKFQGYVELYPTLFAVDARSSMSVSKLACHMRTTSETIRERVPKVYGICEEVQKVLCEWRSENSNEPAMKWDEFCYMCQSRIEALRIRSRRDNLEKMEARRRAIVSSLQYLGELIYFDELGFLVLDCEWFCRDVIGLLIRMGGKQQNVAQRKGFIPRKELEKLLRKCLESWIPGAGLKTIKNIKVSDLIEMMVKLDLCYEQNPQDQHSEVLVPFLLEEKLGKLNKWISPTLDGTYVGRHFERDDSNHMFLTPGFFARLQVNLHNKILGPRQQHSATYTLERHLILINVNGVDIRIEYGGEYDQYVDVLACSNKKITEVIRLIQNLVVPSILALCRGVTLTESILRPKCVQELMPPRDRKLQQVLLQQLKGALLSLPANDMYEYQHTWPPVAEGSIMRIPSGFDFARDLLSEDEFNDVLQKRYHDLHRLAIELAVAPANNTHEPSPEAEVKPQSNVEPTILGIAKGIELVLQRLKFIEQELKDIKHEIQGLRYYEHILICKLHREINNLANFSMQLEEHRVPIMFYFVQGTGSYSRRLVTRMISSITPLRLHMLCEMRGEIHVVEDQLGCEVMKVDNIVIQQLAPYVNKFMKLLMLALKVGAHFAVGLGELIPDLSKELALVDSSIVYGATAMVAGALMIGGSRSSRQGSSRDIQQEFRVAQQWLKDFLQEQKCYRGKDIAEKFSLWRVRYRDNGQIAWICRRHRESRLNEIIEVPV
ncbi:protein TORNADO 1 isoform X2 [Nymphaea colorata]|nr:protein TORNADO 1 isoform X2 [Nymphaea colorata]XP_031478120.1 protein TORNADO 1 isoform X2 [Nymphaea colorata]